MRLRIKQDKKVIHSARPDKNNESPEIENDDIEHAKALVRKYNWPNWDFQIELLDHKERMSDNRFVDAIWSGIYLVRPIPLETL